MKPRSMAMRLPGRFSGRVAGFDRRVSQGNNEES
jgi:hypothetical protein